MITLMQAIQALRPGAQCRIIGDTYNDITWDDKNQTIPTEDEVDKKLKELQADEPMALLREERNIRLAQTDWRASSDLTLSSAWRTYRQQLRDLTSGLDTVDKVNNVTWPTKPS